MVPIIFLLFSAVTEYNLELSHPRGEEAGVLSTSFHASLVECCSQDSISTCPMYPSELQQPKKTLGVVGTCHWKPAASSRASRVEGVSTGPTAPDALPCSHLKTHVCPVPLPQPLPAKLNNTISLYMSFSENMLPVSPASELPSLNIHQLAIVLFIGC